jgi:hypothetical protein
MSTHDEDAPPIRYGIDVEIVHCAEPGCPDPAFERYGWRCGLHRKDLDWTCLEPGCDEPLVEGAYCNRHSWFTRGRS